MPEAGNHITIERLNTANLCNLSELFYAVYRRKTDRHYFEKKYNTAYIGVQHIGLIAYAENRVPIAFYGVIPCRMNYDGRVILAAQSADTMTHPQYRNQGWFVKLATQTVSLCVENHIQLLFGFPNEHSLPGFVNKLGWTHATNMYRFAIPVKGRFTARVVKRFPFVYKRLIQSVLQPLTMEEGCVAGEEAGVERSLSYLRYKQYNSSFHVPVSNGKAWVKPAGDLLVGDLDMVTGDPESSVRDLQRYATALGCAQLCFQCTANTKIYSWLAKRYEPIPSFPVIFNLLKNDIDPSRFSFTFADIDTF